MPATRKIMGIGRNAVTKIITTSSALADLTDVNFTGIAQGNVIYYNGSKWVNLAPGTANQVLTTQGTSANPTWTDKTSATGIVGGTDQMVQFNDGGSAFGGVATFKYNKTSSVMEITDSTGYSYIARGDASSQSSSGLLVKNYDGDNYAEFGYNNLVNETYVWATQNGNGIKFGTEGAKRMEIDNTGEIYTSSDFHVSGTLTAGTATLMGTDTIWNAKGDLAAATASDTASRLSIGADNKVLTADSTATHGMEWKTTPAVADVGTLRLSVGSGSSGGNATRLVSSPFLLDPVGGEYRDGNVIMSDKYEGVVSSAGLGRLTLITETGSVPLYVGASGTAATIARFGTMTNHTGTIHFKHHNDEIGEIVLTSGTTTMGAVGSDHIFRMNAKGLNFENDELSAADVGSGLKIWASSSNGLYWRDGLLVNAKASLTNGYLPYVTGAALGGVANSSVYHDSTGKVGINTNSPNRQLDVRGTTLLSGNLGVTGTTEISSTLTVKSDITGTGTATLTTGTYPNIKLDPANGTAYIKLQDTSRTSTTPGRQPELLLSQNQVDSGTDKANLPTIRFTKAGPVAADASYTNLGARIYVSGETGAGTINAPQAFIWDYNSDTLDPLNYVELLRLGTDGALKINKAYTMPTAAPGANGYVITGATDGTTAWVANTGGGGSTGYWSLTGSNIYYNSGNVGIGADDPAAKLHVRGNTVVSGNLGINTISPTAQLHIDYSNEAHDGKKALHISSGSTTAFVVSGGSSQVGIGTGSPTTGAMLDVSGGSVYVNAGLGYDTSAKLQVDGRIKIKSGDIEMPGMAIYGAILRDTGGFTDTEFQSNDGTHWTWDIDGSEVMRLDQTGLGVGTSSPHAMLEVSGQTDQPAKTLMHVTSGTRSMFQVSGNRIGFGPTGTNTGAMVHIDNSHNGSGYALRTYAGGIDIAGGGHSLNWGSGDQTIAAVNSAGTRRMDLSIYDYSTGWYGITMQGGTGSAADHRVGINTVTPLSGSNNAILDVSGSQRLYGSLELVTGAVTESDDTTNSMWASGATLMWHDKEVYTNTPGTSEITGGGAANYISYFTAANNITGTADFVRTATGIGIGTNNPAYALDVSGANDIRLGSGLGTDVLIAGTGHGLTRSGNGILLYNNSKNAYWKVSDSSTGTGVISGANILFNGDVAGYVGIRTNAPSYPLHVVQSSGDTYGMYLFNSNSRGVAIGDTDNAGTGYGKIGGVGGDLFLGSSQVYTSFIPSSDGSVTLGQANRRWSYSYFRYGQFGYSSTQTEDTAAGGYVLAVSGNSDRHPFMVKAFEKTTPNFIVASGGNVGVGTTSPDTNLDIESSTTAEPVVTLQNTTDDATSPELIFRNTRGGAAGSNGDDAGIISAYAQADDDAAYLATQIIMEGDSASSKHGEIQLHTRNTDTLRLTQKLEAGTTKIYHGDGASNTTFSRTNEINYYNSAGASAQVYWQYLGGAFNVARNAIHVMAYNHGTYPGYVGIGTTAPVTQVATISGAKYSFDNTTDNTIYRTSDSVRIDVTEKVKIDGALLTTSYIHQDSDSASTGVIVGGGGDANVSYDGTNMKINSQRVGSGDLHINPAGGNVGIGQDGPNQTLDVKGNTVLGESASSTHVISGSMNFVDRATSTPGANYLWASGTNLMWDGQQIYTNEPGTSEITGGGADTYISYFTSANNITGTTDFTRGSSGGIGIGDHNINTRQGEGLTISGTKITVPAPWTPPWESANTTVTSLSVPHLGSGAYYLAAIGNTDENVGGNRGTGAEPAYLVVGPTQGVNPKDNFMAGGRAVSLILAGTSGYNGETNPWGYGNFGSLLFHGTSGWTGGARRWLVSNAWGNGGAGNMGLGFASAANNAAIDPTISGSTPSVVMSCDTNYGTTDGTGGLLVGNKTHIAGGRLTVKAGAPFGGHDAPQMTLAYDGSNYMTFRTDSSGILTISGATTVTYPPFQVLPGGGIRIDRYTKLSRDTSSNGLSVDDGAGNAVPINVKSVMAGNGYFADPDIGEIQLYSNDNSIGDTTGKVTFNSINSAGGSNYKQFAFISGSIHDPTATEEAGQIDIGTLVDGTSTPTMTIVSGNVGIGTAAPGFPLSVSGTQYDMAKIASSHTAGSCLYLDADGTGGSNWHLQSTADGAGSGGGKLDFVEAGTSRMIIAGGGNVGIGTVAPSRQLSIVNNAAASTLGLYTYGNISNGAIGGTIDFNFQGGGAAEKVVNSIRAQAVGTNEDAAKLIFYTTEDSDTTEAGAAGTERMIITPAGDVGIGTTGPNTTLDVKGTTTLGGNTIVSGTVAITGSNLTLTPNSVAAVDLDMGGSTAATRWRMSPGTDFRIYDNWDYTNQRFTIQRTTGYVGIGTTGPNATLDVKGTTVLGGDVTVSGTISATAKSFDIPHPDKKGMRLIHGSLEGPEHGVYVRGTTKGYDKTTIELPDYWETLVGDDYTLQLTSYNSSNVYIIEKGPTHFTVGSNSLTYKFDYFAVGTREEIEVEIDG